MQMGPDQTGNTPAYLARKKAASPSNIHGMWASRTQQNEDGNTPLMCLEQASQNERISTTAMGMNLV
jgi:hypothetical protein